MSNLMTDAMAGGKIGDGTYSVLALVPGRALFWELGKRLMSAKAYLRGKKEMDALRDDWQAKTDKVRTNRIAAKICRPVARGPQ